MFDFHPLQALVQSQIGGGTPSRQVRSNWNGGIPWASVKDFSDDSAVLSTTQETISTKGLRNSASHLIEANTPLVCTRMAVGRAALALMSIAINQDVKALLPRAGVTPEYLLNLMRYARPQAEARAIGSTVLGISIPDYLGIKVPSAPPREQPKIAEILTLIDSVILHSSELIKKLNLVKLGLLHDLLTRGIDSNGEIRPSVSEEPAAYKMTSVGPLPIAWQTDTLGRSCARIKDGTHLPPVRVESGPLLLSVRNMKNGELVLTADDTRISQAFYNGMHRHWQLQQKDVLLAIVGATIGKIAQVREMPPFTLQRSVAVLRGKERRLDNDFLFAYLGTRQFQTALWAEVNQTAQPGIYLTQLASICIPLPPMPEQEAITARLAALQARIKQEELYLDKSKSQKAGLMKDLLTGRVRVTSLLKK